jgi:hypothetical protein
MMAAAVTEFAECGEYSVGSGSRKAPSNDLYSTYSAIPAGEDWASLEWDTYSPPAGSDQKPSWGFGGEAPDESHGECAGLARGERVGLSSLDQITNNRNKHEPDYFRRPIGRGKFCGRYCIKGIDPKTGRVNYRRINCGSWSCSYCGPRKARTARAAIRRTAEGLGLKYFLTLTLDPKKLEHKKFAVPHLRLCFNKFREYLKRKYGTVPPYICVLEFTQAGIPHLHILLDRYIPQAWISQTWAGLGGGRIVFIKQVTIANVTRYLSKYLTKELLLSAPKGSRRITTARSIKLFPKFASGISWELLRSTIWWNLLENQMRDFKLQRSFFDGFISLEYDEETFLKAFQLHPDGVPKVSSPPCAQ